MGIKILQLEDSESHDENYINIDITQLVQDMVNYPDENYGLMLILKSETKYTRMALCSSDHTDNSRHPKIEIKYSIPTTSLYFSPSKEAELRLNLCPGYEYVANTNYKSSPYCFADEWTQSGYRTNKKYIFDYDISYLPAGTIIKKADLTFTAYNDPVYDKWHMNRIITNNSGYKSNACWLSEITSYWNDNTVTYNSMPDISVYNHTYLPDAEFHDQNYNNIDVTNLVENKYKYPENKYGFMLHLVKEEKYTRMAFHNGVQLKIDFYDKEAFSIPFTVNGSTINESNDWDVQGPDGNDIAYLFYLPSQTNITATVCNSITDYDTKLEIFNMNKTNTGYYNDDYPDCGINSLFSEIEYASLLPGYYYIVVDGYGGNSGNFELNVSEYSYKSSILETSDTTFYESINQVEKEKKQEERFEPSVKIYPNPAQNELNIQLFNIENAELRMFNVTGKLVDAWSINANQLIINTEKYNNGLYLIWISTGESTFHERVIISK